MKNRSYGTSTFEFSVGSILGRTLSTLFAHPALFFGLALMTWVPGTATELLSQAGNSLPSIFGGLVAQLVSLTCYLLVEGATAYAVLRVLRSEGATIGESLARGIDSLGALVRLGLLMGLAFLVASLPLFGLSSVIADDIGGLIGQFFLSVAIIIAVCVWIVAIPTCVVERLGAIDSLRCSAKLTKGYRWKIFALFMPMLIVFFAASEAGSFVPRLFSVQSKTVETLTTQVVLLIPETFWSVMTSIIYYALREAKEGVSVDSLASVFD